MATGQQNKGENEIGRRTKRGVWSSSVEEEDKWIDALNSLVSNHSKWQTRNSGASDEYIDGTEVPKIIHFIWLGPHSIPEFPFLPDVECVDLDCNMNEPKWNKCMLSWKKHHSSSEGWKIHVWTEKDVVDSESSNGDTVFQLNTSKIYNLEGFQHAMKICHFALASDILRLEILRVFGGVYVDIDYWCLQCLDTVTSRSQVSKEVLPPLQFFCGQSNTGCLEINNGLMASCKSGHPILIKMMCSVQTYCNSFLLQSKAGQVNRIHTVLSSFLSDEILSAMQDNQELVSNPSSMDVIEHTGPGLLTRTVFRWLCNDAHGDNIDSISAKINIINSSTPSYDVPQVMVFNSNVFHPLPNHFRKDYATKLEDFIVKGITVAVHLWGCSWQSNRLSK